MANITDKPFLTVEDLNTALLMFKKGLKKEFVINTSFMTDADKAYDYEFATIEKTVSGNVSTYSIEYPAGFGKCHLQVSNYSNPSITYGNHSITIEISNEESAPIFSLYFNVVPDTNNNTIVTDLFIKDYFYTAIIGGTISIPVYNNDGTYANNKTIRGGVSLNQGEYYEGTITNGVFNLDLSYLNDDIVKGENTLYLYENTNNTWKIFATIDINVYPLFFEFKPSGTVYRDALNDIEFDIFYHSLYDDLDWVVPTDATLKINNKEYTNFIVDNKKLIFPDVDLYGFHNDNISLNLILEDTDKQLEYNNTFRVICEYATFNDVITLTNPSPATAIVEDSAYVVSAPIDLDSNLNLIFEENAILSDIVFNVYDESTFKLNGGVLENCNIVLTDGILELKDMEIYDSENPIKSESNTEVTINSTYFHDNIKEDIVANGKLTVINSKFLKQNVEDLNTLRPAFITITGETTLNNNQFDILYGEVTGNIGMAYVMFSINENAMLNTNKGNTMKNNNTFNKQKNKGTINVVFNNKTIDCQDNCFTWTVQNTNTVYHNNIRITEE